MIIYSVWPRKGGMIPVARTHRAKVKRRFAPPNTTADSRRKSRRPLFARRANRRFATVARTAASRDHSKRPGATRDRGGQYRAPCCKTPGHKTTDSRA